MMQPLFSIKNEMTGEFQAPFYRKNAEVAKFEWNWFLISKKTDNNPTLKYQKLYRLPYLFNVETGEIQKDSDYSDFVCERLEVDEEKE